MPIPSWNPFAKLEYDYIHVRSSHFLANVLNQSLTPLLRLRSLTRPAGVANRLVPEHVGLDQAGRAPVRPRRR